MRPTQGISLRDLIQTGEQKASWMRVDAIVRTSSTSPTPRIADPGIGCYVDADHGWLAQLGTRSAIDLIAEGSSTALLRRTPAAVRPLTRQNHVVLTCDATGSQTLLSLSVNGTTVAHEVAVGKPVRFDRFGIWAAGEGGAVVQVPSISAITR